MILITVEQIKFNNDNKETTSNNEDISHEKEISDNVSIKDRINEVINNIIKEFGKVDYNVGYMNNKGPIIGKLFLASPLSANDIRILEGLSLKMNFNYNVIIDSKKIKKKDMNTLIEISLDDEN